MNRSSLLSAVLILMLSVPQFVMAQSATITGQVTDTDGVPLPGATVSIMALNMGTATDVEGNYSLNVPERLVDGRTVQMSARFVGYATAQQAVTLTAGTQTVNFQLGADLLNLDEVVVTGTGTATSRRRVAIDVASVSGEDLETALTPSLDRALAGKIPGAQITQGSQPGAPSQIILRGVNTLGSTNPLILLDGVPITTHTTNSGTQFSGVSRLSDIDFSDIERVEVVKGAAAAGLYGAQGANGVIQLFTRQGVAGRPRISFSTSMGASHYNRGGVEYADLHSFPVDDNGNIIDFVYDANGNLPQLQQQVGAGAITNNEFRADGQALPLYNNINAIMQPATNLTTNLSVNGGSDQLTYLASVGIVRHEGVELGTGFDRNTFRLNLGSQLADNFRVDARVNLINSISHGESVQGNSVNSQIGSALVIPRYINLEQIDETTGMYRAQHHAGQTSNSPLFYKEINDRGGELVRILQNTQVQYQPFDFLDLNYTLGIDYYNNEFTTTQQNVEDIPASRRGPVLTPQGFIDRTQESNSDITSNATAFIRTGIPVGMNVASTTQFTYEWRQTNYQWVYAGGTGLSPLPGLETIRAISNRDSDESRTRFVTYGFLVNQKFDIGNYGGFEVGVRQDYSSAFRQGEEAEFFPRGAVYFRPVEFMSDNVRNTVTELKLRAAYGSAGTQPGAYDRIVTLTQGSIGTTGGAGTLYTPSTLPNPLLAVERSSEGEIGADLGFRLGTTFFSTLGVNVTGWTRSSDDVIYPVGVAPSTGSTSRRTNAFTIESSGIDLGIESLVFYTPRFAWNAQLNFGMQDSKVSSIQNGEDVVINVQSGQTFILREGYDVGSHFGYYAVKSVDEINPVTGQRYVPEGQEHLYAVVDGNLVNVNTQRVLFRSNQEVIGNAAPDFTLGFRNAFTLFRHMNIAFQLDWVQGPDIYNATRQRMYQYNLHADQTEPVDIRGMQPGPDGNIVLPTDLDGNAVNEPAAWTAYYNSIYNTSQKNEYFIEDGSFLKLRELSVSYDLGSALRTVLPVDVRNFRVQFTGQNLLTFTKYSGFDPEVNQGGTSSLTRGFDYNSFPQFRTYTIGISTTF